MKFKFVAVLFIFTCYQTFAQQTFYWKTVNASQAKKVTNGKPLFAGAFKPFAYSLFQLNETDILDVLKKAPPENQVSILKSSVIITLPVGNGKFEKFKLIEVPVMETELAKKYSSIKTYLGQSVKNSGITVRCDFTVLGFHAMITFPDRATVYINPVNKSSNLYAVYERNKKDKSETEFSCELNSLVAKGEGTEDVPTGNADDGILRTFRLALCSTGEFSDFYMTGSEHNRSDSIATVLSALTTLLSRNNEIYERDLNIRLIFVNNEDDIIFLDPKTDGFNSNNLNAQCQKTCDSIIGNESYDLGHVLHKASNDGNGGCIGCVCKTGLKGSGATSFSNPDLVDYLVVDYLSHEMGHQFGANHTFSRTKSGSQDSPEGTSVQVEPGSGSTIMGYAGIAGQYNIQQHSDDYFHALSIAQIINYVRASNGGGKCVVGSASNNKPPSCDAGANYTIPKSTPFALTGAASDADASDVLTYTWEEIDNRTQSYSGFPQENIESTKGPMFRSVPYSTSKIRYFPDLQTILAGATSNKWEALPVVSRDLNFRFTVKDNHAGAGSNNSDDVLIKVSDLAGPFIVTFSDTTTWVEGDNITIQWNVANTNAAPVNCTAVNILLSTDGGLTFSYTLALNTPNDGSEQIVVPIIASSSTTARIKIEASDNVFFDISDATFKVKKSSAVSYLSFTAEKTANDAALLKWSTASENSNDHFEIEKSKDQMNFVNIGSVPAGNSPDEVQNYTYTDNSPYNGINYYRLKQVSTDGKFTYSALAQVFIGASWSIQPNPAINNLKIVFTTTLHNIQVALINASGKSFLNYQQELANANESITLPVSNVAGGIYFLKLTADSETSTQRVLIMH